MSSKQINTVIVLRNDQTTAWESSDHIMLAGEVGIGYLPNGNVIAKLGDGEHTWSSLKQLEGVLEDDITLTYNFGRHVIKNGSVNAGGKGMTTNQWLIDALSEIKEPNIIKPNASLSASAVGGGEIGSYITGLKWDGSVSYGSYEYGSVGHVGQSASGLSSSDVSWAISNSHDIQTAATEDGTFTLGDNKIQIDSESRKEYAQITGVCTLDVTNARTPINNVGNATEGKITGFSDGNTQKSITASVFASSYRKPFWGVLAPADVLNVDNLTSADIRGLSNSGTSNKGLPSSIAVPAGSQMVIFAAKAGVYSSLVAKDTAAMNAVVSFEKVTNAVAVEGANGFTAADYDIWYVNWGAGIGSAKQLSLTWA